jgi:ADP-ribosylglycohydrolase
MYGAILGDIVGSPYEFDCNNYKAKDFPLFSRGSDFTDDTVMTLAVAKALLSTRGQDDAAIKAALVREMQQLGRAYPDRGYGTHFGGWLYEDDPQPYQSYGNGSAMRVSPTAWLATDMAETLRLARLTAQVTHDHPEGIKGAQVTEKRKSRRMWSASLATTSAEPAMRFVPPITMWRAVRKPYRRLLLHFWKAQVLKTLSAQRCPLAVTATPSPPSPAVSLRRSTACRRNCGTSAASG